MRCRTLLLGMATLAAFAPACALDSDGVTGSAGAGPTSSSSSGAEGGSGPASSGVGAAGSGPGGGGSASGSGAGGSGGVAAAGGGGGTPGETNCFDGLDDDGDGDADCADEDCTVAGATCVRKPMSAIDTFVMVLPEQTPCPAGMVGPEATVACPGCGCVVDAPGVCDSTARFHDSTDCTDADPTSVPLTVMCNQNLGVPDGSTEGDSTPGGMGQCSPDAAVPAPTPVVKCSVSVDAGGGCDANQVCAPAAAPCILLPDPGDPCPLAYYKTTLLRDGATACGACVECTVGDQVCGALDYAVYDDNNSCNSPTDTVLGGACTALGANSSLSLMLQSDPAAVGAQCSAFASPNGGGAPLRKICCR